MKKIKKWKNEQPWTLGYTSIFQIMSSPLSLTNLFSLQNDAM
jgi:hypothetical protein